mmetsp:Transcript_9445/g.17784  ORF Transcript_9445/g.17784 Transcript_9445/m.17784 type:complete len:124 (-) Transcript_9445:655-1026(-)
MAPPPWPFQRSADLVDAFLRLWSTSGEADAPPRAERLLTFMDRTYLAGNDACRLRASSFDGVITAWCRSAVGWKANNGDATEEEEDVLLAALEKEAPKRAEAILFASRGCGPPARHGHLQHLH